MWSSNSSSLYIFKGVKSLSSKCVCPPPHVYCNIIYNIQDRENKCLFMDDWIKKMWHIYIHTHTYIYNGIFSNNKKLGFLSICDKMEEAWGYNSKWNESDKHKYFLISLICGTKKNLSNFICVFIWAAPVTCVRTCATAGTEAAAVKRPDP